MYTFEIVYKYIWVYLRVCVCLLQGVYRWRAIEGSGAKGMCATFVFPKNECICVFMPYIGAVMVAISATHLFPYGNTISSIINQKRQ